MSERKRVENLIMENIPGNCIYFKNFSGKPDEKFNRYGQRTFHIALENEYAEELEKIGWYIKWPKEGYEDQKPLLKVRVNFDGDYPPDIWIVDNRRKTKKHLNSETIRRLDRYYIENIEVLVISPSSWEADDGSIRYSAYVKSMSVSMEEDLLTSRYGDYRDLDAPVGNEEDEEVPF